jgi:RNA polymerase sigma-70 factor (ECF subfamily)
MIAGKMPVELDNEIALVRLAQSGSAEAFGLLVNRYEQQVYRLVRAITTNDAHAEELLEATFLKAHESLGQFNGEERFYTRLARIAVNAALSRLRHCDAFTGEMSGEQAEGPDAMSTLRKVREWGRDATLRYGKAELDAILSGALEEIETPWRIIFVLGDMEGFSLEEIADILGLSVPVVKTSWMRARLKLRNNLSPWFESLSVPASK